MNLDKFFMKNSHWRIALVILIFATITTAAFFAASALQENTAFQEYVKSAGMLGVVVIGVLCGLNAVVPLPAATFAPLFIEAGLSPWLVIGGFVFGTALADSLSYLIGWFGRGYVNDKHPNVTRYFTKILTTYETWAPYVIFAYFTLAPLPNELILLPLALLGYQYKKLLLPLIIGNIIHQSLMVFGYSSLFSFFF